MVLPVSGASPAFGDSHTMKTPNAEAGRLPEKPQSANATDEAGGKAGSPPPGKRIVKIECELSEDEFKLHQLAAKTQGIAVEELLSAMLEKRVFQNTVRNVEDVLLEISRKASVGAKAFESIIEQRTDDLTLEEFRELHEEICQIWLLCYDFELPRLVDELRERLDKDGWRKTVDDGD